MPSTMSYDVETSSIHAQKILIALTYKTMVTDFQPLRDHGIEESSRRSGNITKINHLPVSNVSMENWAVQM